MQKSRFYPVYRKDGKTRFPARNRPGVYIIKEGDEIVYIGHSTSDLYKTMYRHFQDWRTWWPAVSYAGNPLENYSARIVYCTEKQAVALEKMLIRKYNPRDNTRKYESLEPDSYETQTLKRYIALLTKTVKMEELEPPPF